MSVLFAAIAVFFNLFTGLSVSVRSTPYCCRPAEQVTLREKKTSIETYYELFYRWQLSGLSKAAFADREGVPKVSFYSWCRKFEAKTDSQGSHPGFTRIELAEHTVPSAVARVNYPGGISVELFGSVDPDWIKALVF